MKRQDATGPLELVRSFINTRDLELEVDALSTPGALRAWLADSGLADASVSATGNDLAWAISVREALRDLARGNSGTAARPEAVQVLDRLAGQADVRLRLGEDGGLLLDARPGGGVQEALGRLLAIVGQSSMEGTWPRLKICPAQSCSWAFYDHSKNRSGVWCQMAECGNRAKARRYQARHPSTPDKAGTQPRETDTSATA